MRWPVVLIAIAVAWLPARQETPLLRAAGAIPMAGVDGRIDHLSVDLAGQRLFVAALGNNSVEVLDLRTMRDVKSIPGFHEP